MKLEELEAEALKLPAEERALLARRLLASLESEAALVEEDPILGLGSSPVVCDAPDGSVEHDRHLYDPAPQ